MENEREEGRGAGGRVLLGPAAAAAAAAAAAEDDNEDSKATCLFCAERWTCTGAHRICCIPCGHVYGRSCLELWVKSKGAKPTCPQCGKDFKSNHIINLFAPKGLLDGCCRIQDLKAQMVEEVNAIVGGFQSQLAEEKAKIADQLKSEYADAKATLIEQLRSEFTDKLNKQMEEIHIALGHAYQK